MARANRAQITGNASVTYQGQHVVWHVVPMDSSAVKPDRADIACMSALFHWLKPITDEEGGGWGGGGGWRGDMGRKPMCSEKIPDDELQKMPSTNAQKLKT